MYDELTTKIKIEMESRKVTVLQDTDWTNEDITIKCPVCGKDTKGMLDDGDGYHHQYIEEKKYAFKGYCTHGDSKNWHSWKLEASIKNVKLEFNVEFDTNNNIQYYPDGYWP